VASDPGRRLDPRGAPRHVLCQNQHGGWLFVEAVAAFQVVASHGETLKCNCDSQPASVRSSGYLNQGSRRRGWPLAPEIALDRVGDDLAGNRWRLWLKDGLDIPAGSDKGDYVRVDVTPPLTPSAPISSAAWHTGRHQDP
jgi:hypothetical protein